MALQKQGIPIPLSLGLDQKTDPKQVQPGKFLSLVNYVFNEGKVLTKRNGFGKLSTLPSGANATTLTTFNGNLTAIGRSLYAFSDPSKSWLNMGRMQPVQLSVAPVVRSAQSETAADVAVSNDIACAVFEEDSIYKYQIVDIATGQSLVASTTLPSSANVPRVFVLGNYFIITFLITITATPHLQYISVPVNNLTNPSAATDISTLVGDTATSGYDGCVANNNLYLAWDASDMGGAIRTAYMTAQLLITPGDVMAGTTAALVSVTVDTSGSTSTVWVSVYDGTDCYTASFSQQLVNILPFTQFLAATPINQLTSTAQNNIVSIFYQVTNTYSYSAVASDYIEYNTVEIDGTVGTAIEVARSVGLASKAFLLADASYMLAVYGGTYQPTYFLIDSSGSIVAKVAYSNGGGYLSTQVLPNYSIAGNVVQIGYLIKDLITSVNKAQDAPSVAGVYSQTGVNVASFDLSANKPLITAEIGGSLYIAGGILWQYDGFKPVEQGFHVWPEDMLLTVTNSGGSMSAQQYFYVATYEWTDGSGKVHRSAPSIPLSATTSGGSSIVKIDVPTLRLTYKRTPNQVRICIYRWSVSQQTYYMVTDVQDPLLNDPSVDSVSFDDDQADASILGNAILYTTGGVVENIGAPACSSITLSQNRLMLIAAEDRDLIWFSKQVIQATPVEMSDLFTKYIAPTQGSQGSTGPSHAICPMDDKTIVFKANAAYYFTGTGPDNLGSNNDFSEATYITSAIGTDNQQSVVLTPFGIILDTDKGRWMLGRDLSTKYVGDAVEDSNEIASLSSLTIPGTNQVRIILENNTMLMYDYYYQQWGTFSDILAIAGTLYQGLHTYLNSSGQVYQETPGVYLDGSRPVLGSFVSGWFNMAGLQGFQRLYFLYILGQYFSPHKSQLLIGYDYNSSPSQAVTLSPNLTTPAFGAGGTFYGDESPYGGNGDVEQYRVFAKQQKCQAFQLTFNENFDNTQGQVPGAGLSLSGLNLVIGVKGSYPRLPASKSVG